MKTVTTLDLTKVTNIRRASIAATFLMATSLALTGCGDPAPNVSKTGNDWNVEQSDGQSSRLVQGRENCIRALINDGRTRTDAQNICDNAFAQAQVRTASNGTHAGGGNNALLWYMIGRNNGHVSVYEGNPSNGLRHVGGYSDRYTPTTMNARPYAGSSVSTGSGYKGSTSAFHGSTSRGGFSPGHGIGGHGG